ncbi:Rho termination factor N-terminal domain-containing protein [Granulosicoccus antarcticus]|uniref:Rho termination factor-like N-terminal domain-containing protein n=1 Tax=Granulosicoccus antarcticus IMCC3135 TaxID=1192854 RepID=A0A2Z2NIU1_9GAMM|nr:Rho termination factor N-terminal domain-containing protein [Granulosicoccus antarcticus]ASJ70983.1 hypothetical protein IMCC3135_04350 [Granulosicoccus antarcticus IMCC3135]
MIKELNKSIKKRPVEWLAIGAGVIAVAVVARKLTETPTRREQLLGNLQSGLGHVRQSGTELWHEGVDSAQTMQKEASALKASLAPGAGRENSSLLDKVTNHDGAIAAFMATLLAKGVSSYFEWKSAEEAREQGRKTSSSSSDDNSEQALDEMTVVELRKEAAEKEVEGRSSMNKEDLVEALKQ